MFDEEPDDDLHGPCAHEIARLSRMLSDARARTAPASPVDLVLFCPDCGLQHIDAADTNYDPHYEGHLVWMNPPHRSHLCAGCGHIWRPADVPTNGVAAVLTSGKSDSALALPARRGRST